MPAVADAYAELAGERTPITDRRTRPSGHRHPDSPGSTAPSTRRCSTRSRRAAQGRDRPRAHAGRPAPRRVAAAVGGLESRTHASQGEQRTLALALRLGGHRLCAELTDSAPVLLLDDVFSELDDQRAVALVAHLDAAADAGHHGGHGAARDLGRPHAARRRRSSGRRRVTGGAVRRRRAGAVVRHARRRSGPSSGSRAGNVHGALDDALGRGRGRRRRRARAVGVGARRRAHGGRRRSRSGRRSSATSRPRSWSGRRPSSGPAW